ncbi:MAG: hypothetical protein IJ617_00570 [Oscillospiraceae bacterium]|nr:hypothetical protein [Oscillospiraceae bacterium]
MKLLEYLLSVAPEGVFRHHHGVLSFDTTVLSKRREDLDICKQRRELAKIDLIQSVLEEVTDIGHFRGIYYPTKEEMIRLNDIELRLDPGVEEYDTYVRRPYYRMRGKSVTPEQARDIIRRTDRLVDELSISFEGQEALKGRELIKSGDFVGSMNFDQWWFSRNHIPTHYGWSHPDGRIGCNAITQRFPNFGEYLSEMLRWKLAFPYLDLTIAVSFWDEQPPYWWEAYDEIHRKWLEAGSSEEEKKFDEYLDRLYYMEYPDFCENLEIGICTHDNVIEFLNPKNAARRYLDYEARYGAENPDIYVPEYYEDNKLLICDNAYLIRCLTDYGMSEAQAWELVRGEPEYIWTDARFYQRI